MEHSVIFMHKIRCVVTMAFFDTVMMNRTVKVEVNILAFCCSNKNAIFFVTFYGETLVNITITCFHFDNEIFFQMVNRTKRMIEKSRSMHSRPRHKKQLEGLFF